MTSALRSLEPYYAGGWSFEEGPGYYVHRGYVYIMGQITNGAGAVTQDILKGLPPALRPAAPVKITLVGNPQETQQTRDAAEVLPLTWASTVDTEGNWSLDEPLPEQVNVAPPEGTYWYYDNAGALHPRYSQPMPVAIVIGNARWPLASAGLDTFAPLPLAPYLTANVTDIDSGYLIHDSRVHLTGHVAAVVDGPGQLFAFPPGTHAGLPGGSSETEADGFPLLLGSEHGVLIQDQMGAAADDPPLGAGTPEGKGPKQNFRTPGTGGFVPGVLHGETFVEEGKEECKIGATKFECAKPTGIPSLVASVTALLGMCQPTPDWFALHVTWTYLVRRSASICDHVTGCLPIAENGTVTIAGGGRLALVADAAEEAENVPTQGGIEGWFAPAVPVYKGSVPGGLLGGGVLHAEQALWRPGEIGGIELSTPLQINRAEPNWTVQIIPLYEQRQHGLHAGDTITLDGSGWEGLLSSLSTVMAAPGQAGHVARRGVVVGHAASAVTPSSSGAEGATPGTISTTPGTTGAV